MGMGFSCRKNAFFQAPIKLAQPVPAPELRAKHVTDTRNFLIFFFFVGSDNSHPAPPQITTTRGRSSVGMVAWLAVPYSGCQSIPAYFD